MKNINAYRDVILTDNYQGMAYKNNLNDHIVSVLDYASANNDSEILKSKDLKFSKQLYWECLNVIYEKNPIAENSFEKVTNRALKQNLYRHIIEMLGTFFNFKDELLIETIDFTVSNYIDNYKYQDKLLANNPFSFANNVFISNKLLYSFSDNKDEYSHLFKEKKKESELSKNLTIGVFGKGNRKGYAHTYIKDIYALRNLLINLLDEKNHDSNNPIKITNLYKNLRDLGIPENELSDSNIKNWIVQPLKRFTKIGSNKYGYFIIRTEEDLFESYKSHYKNFMGFYNTLERHRNFAESFNEYQKYKKHTEIFTLDIEDF